MTTLISMTLLIPDRERPYIVCECGTKIQDDTISGAIQEWKLHLIASHLTSSQIKDM